MNPNEHGEAKGVTRPSRGKRFVFALTAVLLSLALVAAVELVLRAVGWGGYPPIVRELASTQEGRIMITDAEGARPYFFANPDHAGTYLEYDFLMPKPPNTVRVFLLGASAIRGYPQPRNLAPSAFLQAMLADVWTNRTVEVINFGCTAVASFPVLDILENAMSYDPDLVVIYAGHNEFYGSFGMASSHRIGSRPWMFRLLHRARSLAIFQALSSLVPRKEPDKSDQLMDLMVGEHTVGPEDWRRKIAADNHTYHVRRMIRHCREANVPAMVCTLPSNERDLAPIGTDFIEGLDAATLAEVSSQLDAVAADWSTRPDEAEPALWELLASYPSLSRAHYYLGKILYAGGSHSNAHRHFVQARDLDSMPWRCTTPLTDGLRAAAGAEGALLCDVESSFRQHSPGGSIGWELMDDHLHPSVRGQALVAETIVRSLTRLTGAIPVSAEDLDRLRPWQAYADELGANPYDLYGVGRYMEQLFETGFVRRNNTAAYQHWSQWTERFEAQQPEVLREVLLEWEADEAITLAVARPLVSAGRFTEALPLLRVAPRTVPTYSPSHLAYTYHELRCMKQVDRQLGTEDREKALREVQRGRILLESSVSEPWIVQRALGRLYLLLEDHSNAVPHLAAARQKLSGSEGFENDGHLVMAYMRLGEYEKARTIAQEGILRGGAFAGGYGGMLRAVESDQQATDHEATESTAP